MKLEKVGSHPEDLPEVSANKLALLLNEKFTCCGKVVRWDYYRKAPLIPLYVSVWRHQQGNKYMLIDYNELLPGVIDFQAREIDEGEQIDVQPDDIIGVFYSRYSISGAIAMTSEDRPEKIGKGGGESDSKLASTKGRVVVADVWEESLSPGQIVDLDAIPHTYSNIKLALQANLNVSDKD